MSSRQAVSAANRFGLGARPGEIAGIVDVRGWLLEQLHGDASLPAFSGLPSSLQYLQREADYLQQRRQNKRAGSPSRGQPKLGQLYRKARLQELGRRYQVAVASEQGFLERLVHFWSNHFAISVDKRQAALYAAPMEREAIRPHVLGSFSELLVAVETHPGMLRYLDNVRSVGSDSVLADRARKRAARGGGKPKREPGLNENLAREILELHTLGVDGGYAQSDVAELARAITGWGVPMPQDWVRGAPASAFVFRSVAHEGGTRQVLGKRYAEDGDGQGRTILADLSRHPATARHVSYKLARHVVSDDPPDTLVERMTQAWLQSDGDLPAVYRALVESPEAWAPQARKFKTPDDFLVSSLRAIHLPPAANPRMSMELLARMGQPPFTPRSPAGFADDAAQWSGPDALWKRVQAAESIADTVPAERSDPLQVANDIFSGNLDQETLLALRRAESPRDGLALLIASPAFQWRT
jgi:uncharacterized protein (DUF1800 family)